MSLLWETVYVLDDNTLMGALSIASGHQHLQKYNHCIAKPVLCLFGCDYDDV